MPTNTPNAQCLAHGVYALLASLALAVFPLVDHAETVAVRVGVKKDMDAQLMTPEGNGPYPAILLLHTSAGLQSGDLDFARQLVSEGYAVLVPSFLAAYNIRAKNRQESFTLYAEPIYADFIACLDDLKANPKVNAKKLGAVGFSNGGYFAMWLAAKGDVRAAELDELLTGLSVPHSFYQYPGAEHRFERDRSTTNDAAAASAWERTRAFLRTRLQP